jgi:hypothetical protein
LNGKISVVDFNPLSTNPVRLQPISYLTRLKFKVTTLKVLTRLNNRVATQTQVATASNQPEITQTRLKSTTLGKIIKLIFFHGN